MSDLAKRLRESVKYRAVHGDAHERGICESQMLEAADEIELLQRRIRALREALQRLSDALLDGMALEYSTPRYDVYQVERGAVQQARDILAHNL